jgi:hypothetical protein
MAQTKRKRRTKHRGNAVGQVEARGRTGRKPTATEKASKAPKVDRRDIPPTWKGAIQRGGIAALIFVTLLLLLFHQNPGVTLIFGIVMLGFYIPMSYYMDQWVYRRRMAKKGGG